jgi:hypothetical protein
MLLRFVAACCLSAGFRGPLWTRAPRITGKSVFHEWTAESPHGQLMATPMRILLTGSSGLIGRALVPFLIAGGHEVTRLVRSRVSASGGVLSWEPGAGRIQVDRLEGFDAVVHLAGETIAGRCGADLWRNCGIRPECWWLPRLSDSTETAVTRL